MKILMTVDRHYDMKHWDSLYKTEVGSLDISLSHDGKDAPYTHFELSIKCASESERAMFPIGKLVEVEIRDVGEASKDNWVQLNLNPYQAVNLREALEAIMGPQSPLSALHTGDWAGEILRKIEKAAIDYKPNRYAAECIEDSYHLMPTTADLPETQP